MYTYSVHVKCMYMYMCVYSPVCVAVLCTEDYGLEVLFNDCWCKSSEMDFLKVC